MYERSPAKLQRQPGVESFQTLLFLSLLRSCRMNMQERLCQRLSVLPDTLSAIRIGSDKCVCLSPLLKTLQSCLWNGPTDLFLTRQRMTHSASWMERSASSITSLLEPRTTMLTVFPGLVQPVICTEQHKTFTGSFKTVSGQTLHSEVCLLFNFLSSAAKYFMWSVMQTLTSLPEPSRLTSSASSAVPSISGVKWSMWAMGLVPRVWMVEKSCENECIYQGIIIYVQWRWYWGMLRDKQNNRTMNMLTTNLAELTQQLLGDISFQLWFNYEFIKANKVLRPQLQSSHL